MKAITLREQHGYGEKNEKTIPDIIHFISFLGEKSYTKSIQKEGNLPPCFNISYQGNQVYHFETAYFVGVDWVQENQLSIHVHPKVNEEGKELDYLKMLLDSLQENDNLEHLEGLYQIDFNKPLIQIEQQHDLLTPLLLIQYLHILKRIVQKGLKKSYYPIRANLHARIKGKVLIQETLKRNFFKQKNTHNYCEYSEFGSNSLDNQILKKAFEITVSIIGNMKAFDPTAFYHLVNYIRPAFEGVENIEVNAKQIKSIKIAAMYKEYTNALRIAEQIFKRYGYNITNIENQQKVHTPPFWVDMSKLFELYVFSQLKKHFPLKNEVIYHQKVGKQELDYLLNTPEYKMVIDAKYKKYENGSPDLQDIRQISGYARLKKVYQLLNMATDKIIDCLIIYPQEVVWETDFKDNFEELKAYNHFYKMGIALPFQKNVII